MKILMLITVLESLTVMFAIVYFYYRRSQEIRRFAEGTTLSFRRANGQGKTLKSKSRPANAGFNTQPFKEGYKE